MIAVTALSALAQDSRLQVYRLLVQAGPEGLAASAIAEQLEIPANTLSFHLKTLSHAGLIQARQDGRFIYYSTNYEQMNALLGFLTENCCGGQSCTPARLSNRPHDPRRASFAGRPRHVGGGGYLGGQALAHSCPPWPRYAGPGGGVALDRPRHLSYLPSGQLALEVIKC